jgi:hypothetical protein
VALKFLFKLYHLLLVRARIINLACNWLAADIRDLLVLAVLSPPIVKLFSKLVNLLLHRRIPVVLDSIVRSAL